MAAPVLLRGDLELRRTAVFSVFALKSDGVADFATQPETSIENNTVSNGNVQNNYGLWVDDQYDKKENMSYEFDELIQFARNRVTAPHEDSEQMSSAALAALRQVQDEASAKKSSAGFSIDAFPEDWGMSQFWYTPATCEVICKAISQQVENMGGQTAGLKIGILSTPSVFLHLRDQKAPFFDDCINFEFDRRFDVFGHQFEFFDFRDGSAVKEKYENYFDLIYIDPPFREEVCVNKNIDIARTIAKKHASVNNNRGRIIFCTGLMFEDKMREGLGATIRKFLPEHTNKLSNPTRCYTTFPCPALD